MISVLSAMDFYSEIFNYKKLFETTQKKETIKLDWVQSARFQFQRTIPYFLCQAKSSMNPLWK